MKHQKLRLLTSASVLSLVALAAACGSDKDASNVDMGTGGTTGKGGAQNNGATGNIILPIPMGGDGSDTPSEGGGNCGFTKLTATPPIVNVLLVVDKSGSMAENKIGAETRWAVLTGALETTSTLTRERAARRCRVPARCRAAKTWWYRSRMARLPFR